MTDSLNESTRAKARELSQQITVAHNLDPDIQEELYGHIEDKLLAYCNGEEPVSQEDAFILAREHFGNGAAVRAMLQEVHVVEVEVGLVRKFLALVIAGGGIGLVGKIALALSGVSMVLAGLRQPLAGTAFLLLSIAIQWAVLLVLYRTLSRWKAGLDSGGGGWYLRWPLTRMIACAAVLYVTILVVPDVTLSREGGGVPGVQIAGVLYAVTVLGLLVASCSLWLWWSGAVAVGGLRYTLNLGAWWVVFMIVGMFHPASLKINFGTGSPVAFGVLSLGSANVGETPVAAYLTYLGPWRTLGEFGMVTGLLATFAMLSCLSVVVCRSVWLRRNARAISY